MQVEGSTRSHSGNNFDFLRFLLSIFVIYIHSYIISSVAAPVPIERLTHGQVELGNIAVGGFFAISGYLITASWLRGKALVGYIIKRVLRIYPAFIVASLLCIYVVGSIGAQNSVEYLRHVNLVRVVLHMLILDKPTYIPPTFEGLRQANILNGSMWTIKPEFECYILTALLGISGLLRKRRIVFALFAAATALNAFVNLNLGSASLHTISVMKHISWITFYLTGIIFLLYRDKIKFSTPYFAGAVAVLVGLVLTRTFDSFSSIPIVYSLMFLAFCPIPHLNKFARYFDVSYGMYLFAWPVQQLCVFYLGNNLPPLELFGIAVPLTFLCALASWFLIEKPFLKMKPKSAKPVSLDLDDAVAPTVIEGETKSEGADPVSPAAIPADQQA